MVDLIGLTESVTEYDVDSTEILPIICWPIYDVEQAGERLKELHELGVTTIIFYGKHRLNNKWILGKGHTGLVVLAKKGNTKVALKIRRTDADRKSMGQEAKMLTLANSIEVAPKLIEFSENFLIMEWIDGPYLREWINTLKESDKPELRKILRSVLHQARCLDRIRLDHGELVRLRRHIILFNGSPIFIDFESASINRRVANLTTVTQSLFLNRNVSSIINKIIPVPDDKKLLHALKKYSIDKSDENFSEILEISGLT
jgi:putative serine/threonine protein kinase